MEHSNVRKMSVVFFHLSETTRDARGNVQTCDMHILFYCRQRSSELEVRRILMRFALRYLTYEQATTIVNNESGNCCGCDGLFDDSWLEIHLLRHRFYMLCPMCELMWRNREILPLPDDFIEWSKEGF